jgi:hypothetical protein
MWISPVAIEKMPLTARSRNHKLIQSALLAATCVAIGYLFLLLPNFEFITASVFIAGYLMGPLHGLFIGLTAELLFSMFNPYGAPSLPLLAAQVVSMGLTGWTGGMAIRAIPLRRRLWQQALLFSGCGLVLTLIYDSLTTLSFAVFLAEGDMAKIWLSYLSGMTFYLVHMVVNTISFGVLVPVLLKRMKRLL